MLSAATVGTAWNGEERHDPPESMATWPSAARLMTAAITVPWPVQVAHKELCGLARRQAAEETLNQQLVQANLQIFSFARLITEHTNITQIFPSLREESHTHYNNVRTMSFLISSEQQPSSRANQQLEEWRWQIHVEPIRPDLTSTLMSNFTFDCLSLFRTLGLAA